jgi:serine/threonine-protein kinase RsbW
MLLALPVPVGADESLYWRRCFRGELDQVRVVRAFAAHLLDGCPVLDDVLLVLDELAVNALRHTRSGCEGGRFLVRVRRDAHRVTVWVSDDGGPGEPRPCVPSHLDELAEGGRGLLTVAALAAEWAWDGDERGRTVWAAFSVPS